MGIGAKVKIYSAGNLCKVDKLIGFVEIGTGFGFCSGQEAVADFGLGEVISCDIEIVWPHGKGVVHKANVKANQFLVVNEPVF
ncbi:MAG: ASPIC/UnbV domain-containing protein [Phycisphaerales bacterium]|nr:MAG: ASPIC/UnbV domain-containing protein [Phycisphaerales bacterium]